MHTMHICITRFTSLTYNIYMYIYIYIYVDMYIYIYIYIYINVYIYVYLHNMNTPRDRDPHPRLANIILHLYIHTNNLCCQSKTNLSHTVFPTPHTPDPAVSKISGLELGLGLGSGL